MPGRQYPWGGHDDPSAEIFSALLVQSDYTRKSSVFGLARWLHRKNQASHPSTSHHNRFFSRWFSWWLQALQFHHLSFQVIKRCSDLFRRSRAQLTPSFRAVKRWSILLRDKKFLFFCQSSRSITLLTAKALIRVRRGMPCLSLEAKWAISRKAVQLYSFENLPSWGKRLALLRLQRVGDEKSVQIRLFWHS